MKHAPFIVSCFLLLWATPSFPSDTLSRPTHHTAVLDSSVRIIVSGLYAYKIPMGALKSRLLPYSTGGLYLDFPTSVPNLFFRTGGDCGQIRAAEPSGWEWIVFEFIASCSYSLFMKNGRVALRPGLGIVNTMIFEIDRFKIDSRFIVHSESEFGVNAGVEPLLLFNRFAVSLPVNMSFVFSSHNPYIHLALGISVGGIF